MTITTGGNLTIVNFDKTSKDTFNSSFTTSGSNFVSDTITINTSSWFTIPTGSNVDFLTGQFTNNDLNNKVYIALGTTNNIVSILSPLAPTCLLAYSGSVQSFAHTSGSNATSSFAYTLVSMN